LSNHQAICLVQRGHLIAATSNPNDIFELPAIRLGSMITGVGLPHVWNRRFKAMIL
jgi:hypothetical protein